VIRPPISPRLGVSMAALLALVLIPGSARALARAPARLAAARTRAAARPGTAARARAAHARAAVPACNPDDPLHPPTVTPGSLMAAIRARGYLIAGVDLTLFHLSYENPLDGQIEGFNIDMLHAISTAIFGSPDRIRFVSLQDAARLPAVESGAVDIVAQPTTVTGAGSFAELQALAQEPPRIVPVGMPYWTDCLVALQPGTVAAVSGDDAILAGPGAQDADTRMVGPTIVAKPQGLARPASHPEFVRFVNAALAQWRAGGGWAASYARWIGRPVPAPPLRYAD
jgi:polar amino acid transport system substrate-binding protein